MNDISFSPWTPWSARNGIEGVKRHGVYLLARFETDPPAHVDLTDPSIFLIAETHDQDLQARWSQFHQTAFHGKDGHYGGWNFRQDFGLAVDREEIAVPSWLYVSAAPLPGAWPADEVTATKAKLIQSFRDTHDRRPRCNRRG